MTDFDLELPILRGALWNNPRGAVIGGVVGAAAGAAFAAAVSGPAAAFWMALASGWVTAYGWAIIEESFNTPGRPLFPLLHEAWTWIQWHAYGLLGDWRRTARYWRSLVASLHWPWHGDQSGSPA